MEPIKVQAYSLCFRLFTCSHVALKYNSKKNDLLMFLVSVLKICDKIVFETILSLSWRVSCSTIHPWSTAGSQSQMWLNIFQLTGSQMMYQCEKLSVMTANTSRQQWKAPSIIAPPDCGWTVVCFSFHHENKKQCFEVMHYNLKQFTHKLKMKSLPFFFLHLLITEQAH